MARPKVQVPLTRLDYLLEGLAVVGLLLLMALPVLYYGELPDRIPQHFGVDGRPDAYGHKTGVLLLPVVGLLLYVVLTYVARIPHKFNYSVRITDENALYQYRNALRLIRWLKTFLIFAFGYITYQSIHTALGNAVGLGRYFIFVFLGVILFLLGYFVVRALRKKGQ